MDDLNDRRRLYFILLYKDTTSYNYEEVLKILKSNKYYAYNEHKPDIDDKKEHTHFFLKLDNACTPQALSKKTGIPINYLGTKVKSQRSTIRYLIHLDDEDKIQYKKSDCVVSKCFERDFNKCFDGLKTDVEIIEDIYNFIYDLGVNQGYASCSVIKQLVIYVNQEGYDSIYKRYRQEFNNYILSCCKVYN